MRELAPGMVEEWIEGFGGVLSRRSVGGVGFGRKPAVPSAGGPGGAQGFSGGLLPRPQRPPSHDVYDDCQLAPDDAGRQATPLTNPAPAPVPTQGNSRAQAAGDGELCYCRHRIFGRGKIVRHLPPDKVQVNFPGFGLKVILSEYLILES